MCPTLLFGLEDSAFPVFYVHQKMLDTAVVSEVAQSSHCRMPIRSLIYIACEMLYAFRINFANARCWGKVMCEFDMLELDVTSDA